MSVISDLKTLYEIDDSLWLEETIEILKTKRYEALDLENLIEELEDLGNEKKFCVASLLEQIIRHFLLLQFWTAKRKYNRSHWHSEIVNFKNQIDTCLTTNLRNYLAQELHRIYQKALNYVREKTDNQVNFTQECSYSLENLLDPNWFPHEN
jgi:23S rRNA maturation mini-RNase III